MTGNDFDKQFMAMMIELRRVGDEIDKRLTGIERRIQAVGNNGQVDYLLRSKAPKRE